MGGRTLRIFRKSSMDREALSCEVYEVKGEAPTLRHKERVKYAPPESLCPPGAKVVEVDGVLCRSLEDMTLEQVDTLRETLRRRPG
jgi:hypothetical protein